MTKPSKEAAGATQSKRTPTGSAKPSGPTVAVIGGGLGGMSAAMRLTRAGFDVTLLERSNRLGGNASSAAVDGANGVEQDVYPHMFCNWYVNFWDLIEDDLYLNREDFFDPRPGVKLRRRNKDEYLDLYNATSMEAVVENFKAGALSPAQTFLLGFAGLDLAAHPFNRTTLNQLGKLDVNGFLYSRGYATEEVAEMENYILTLIWSIQSERTAAATYQNFLRHCFKFPDDSPFSWLLKGSLNDKLVAPFTQKLVEYGCKVETEAEVTSVRVDGDKPLVGWQKPGANRTAKPQEFDYAVLALPAHALSDIVICPKDNLPGDRIIDREKSLAQLRRLSAVPIPVVDLYLNKKIDGFPKEHIGLADSLYGLTVLDISQLWEDVDFDGKTALIIAASDGPSIPSDDPKEQGLFILQEFANYYDWFDAPTCWDDPNCGIDWKKTHPRSNAEYSLLLNDVGSWEWRPKSSYPEKLPRIFFAGDLCRTDVDMATVESAVQSGFQAARALQLRDAGYNGGNQCGPDIEVRPHTTYSTASFRAAKLALLPAAYSALAIATIEQWKDKVEEQGLEVTANEFSLPEYLLLVPLLYTVDWWTSAYWLGSSLLTVHDDQPLIPDRHKRPVELNLSEEEGHEDEVIGLGTATLMMLGECASYAADRLGCAVNGNQDEKPDGDNASIGSVIGTAAKFGEALFRSVQDVSRSSEPYKRFWKVKR